MVYASWRLPPLAAAFNSNTASFLEKIKRNGGFDFSKAAAFGYEDMAAARRLFFFCRRPAAFVSTTELSCVVTHNS